MRFAPRSVRWVVTATFFVGAVASVGCERGPRNVSVPQLDRHAVGADTIRSWTQEEIHRRLGAPAYKGRVGDQTTWIYPVRAFSPQNYDVPAAVLRVVFDSAGIVSEWFFIDPRTMERLQVPDTVASGVGFLKSICRQPIRPIDLEATIRSGQTTTIDLDHVLSWKNLADWAAPRDWPLRRESNVSGRLTWDFYVDRPSAVFIPPFYRHVVFDQSGRVAHVYPSGYGGCL